MFDWLAQFDSRTPMAVLSVAGGLRLLARILHLCADAPPASPKGRWRALPAAAAMCALVWTPGGLRSSKLAARRGAAAPPRSRGAGNRAAQPARRPPGPTMLSAGIRTDAGSRLSRPQQAQAARREARRLRRHTVPNGQFLKGKSVTRTTRQHYEDAVDELRHWCRQHRHSLEPHSLDRTLSHYFEWAFFDGHNASKGRFALYGLAFLQDFAVTKSSFPRALRALAGWCKAAPSKDRPGMPWEAAVALSAWLARRQQHGDLSAARCLIVQFDGYLRPGEAVELCWSAVTPPTPGIRGARRWAVRVRPSPDDPEGSVLDLRRARQGLPRPPPAKAGGHDCTVVYGEPASSAAGRGLVPQLLAAWYRRRGADDARLFDITPAQYAAKLGEACTALGLQKLQLVPHTARHGGPSVDYLLSTRTIAEIKARGRWALDSSVARYRKTGTYCRQLALLPTSLINAHPGTLAALPSLLAWRGPSLLHTNAPRVTVGAVSDW